MVANAFVEDWLKDREETLIKLKQNLQGAQARMKLMANKHTSDRVFQVGDLVYLNLQLLWQ